jgi:acyl-coenzyme A synthetase/AMP-(fatty) acid ligase
VDGRAGDLIGPSTASLGPGGKPHHVTDPAPFRDLDTILAEHGRVRPDRVFLESLAPAARLTFVGLDAATNRLAHFLADRGIGAGDRISVLSDNCPELVVLFLGIQRYGAIVNPVNVEVNARNVGRLLHDVEPRLLLWNPECSAELGDVIRTVGDGAIPFDALFAALDRYPSSPGPRAGAGPGDLALIDHTSGTTATPKGVCISHEAYLYMARSLVERLEIGERDRILEYRALSWASAQCLSLGPTVQTGATLVLARRFSRQAFFGWIREHGVTIAAGVPTVFQMLLAEPVPVTAAEVPTLRFITSSAAPLAAAAQLAFEQAHGIPIVQGCGMTEAGFMGANPPGARRLGSIGPAVPDLEAAFVDDDGGPCRPGETGELRVRGRQMASAYLAARGTLDPIPPDGFRTGDLGYADADGYLFLTGRKKDVIIKGGVNIAPAEITTALLTHPAVAEAATIGVPDPVYGEGIVSFVVPRSGHAATSDELLAHCRTRLSAFKLPRQVVVIDALPRTERGKLAREALRSLWAEAAHR